MSAERPQNIDQLMQWLRDQLPQVPSIRIVLAFRGVDDNVHLTEDAETIKDRATCLSAMMREQMQWREDLSTCSGLYVWNVKKQRAAKLSKRRIKKELFDIPLGAYERLCQLMAESMIAAFCEAEKKDAEVAAAADRFMNRPGLGSDLNSFAQYLRSVLDAGLFAVAGMLRAVRMKQRKPDYLFSKRVMLNTIPRIEDWANQASPGFQTLLRATCVIMGLHPCCCLQDPNAYAAVDWQGENPRIDFSPKIIDWVVDIGWDTRIQDRDYFTPCRGLQTKNQSRSAVANSVVWMMQIVEMFWHQAWPDSPEQSHKAIQIALDRSDPILLHYILGMINKYDKQMFGGLDLSALD